MMKLRSGRIRADSRAGTDVKGSNAGSANAGNISNAFDTSNASGGNSTQRRCRTDS